MIQANLRLAVVHHRQKNTESRPGLLDLIQEGTLGLERVKLIQREGYRFSTAYWIRQGNCRTIATQVGQFACRFISPEKKLQ